METIYIRNINEKVPLNTVKNDIKELCSSYGTVLKVLVSKTLKRKGQAFVVYETKESASDAVDKLKGTVLYTKELEIALAKARSDVSIAREQGEQALDPIKAQRNKKRARPETKSESKRRKVDKNPPHNVLLLQGLSEETAQQVETMYNKLAGFIEARVVPAKGVALVEFDSVENARRGLDIEWEGVICKFAKK